MLMQATHQMFSRELETSLLFLVGAGTCERMSRSSMHISVEINRVLRASTSDLEGVAKEVRLVPKSYMKHEKFDTCTRRRMI
jgi:hypothetical protein